MSCLAQALGQLLLGVLWQRLLTRPGVCVDDDGAFVVWVGDRVGASVLDRVLSEFAWADVLCLPCVPVRDDESALRCGLCRHGDRQSSVTRHRCRIRAVLEEIPVRGVNGVGDGVPSRGTHP